MTRKSAILQPYSTWLDTSPCFSYVCFDNVNWEISLLSEKAEHSPQHGEDPTAYFVTVSAFLQRKEKNPNIKLQLVQILLEQRKDTMVSRQ